MSDQTRQWLWQWPTRNWHQAPRSLGFPLEQIKVLLSLWQDRKRASKDVKALAQKHILELEEKIRELSEMRDVLEGLSQHCAGDQLPDCPILSNLAETYANADRNEAKGGPGKQ
jgi:MerR family copper efflux transcriptional regulator